MSIFSSRNQSEADVPASRSAIWAVLSDPDRLAATTPLVRAISADGDCWCWQMAGISALGVEVAPAFTEQMEFVEEERIEFSHVRSVGEGERAGAEGTYTLTDNDDGSTHLSIDITISIDLPLPKLSKRAVERVMASTMERTGRRFARNLYVELGLDPALVRA